MGDVIDDASALKTPAAPPEPEQLELDLQPPPPAEPGR
jgi:hypothetical protein